MLITSLLLIYAFIISYIAGHACITVMKRVLHTGLEGDPATPLINITGLAALSVFIAVYHFFSPVDARLHLLIFTGLLAYASLNRKSLLLSLQSAREEIKKNVWLLLLLVIVAVISVISRPGTGDIADYHLQAIKWAEHYPNIPGLGNFNRPLANNNWWFNLQAFFGLSFLGVRSVYVLNALFFICTVFYFLHDKPNRFSGMFRIPVLFFLILSIKTAFIGSVTPDFIITMIIFLCIDIYLNHLGNFRANSFYYYTILIFIVWGITIKMLALILLLLVFPITLINKNSISSILVSLLFIVPWVIGNIIACGYILYPFNQIDLFNVDWKVPGFYFEFDRIVLRNWGRVPGNDVFTTSAYSFLQWIPIWFDKFDVFNKMLVGLFACSLPVLLYRLKKNSKLILPVMVLLTGIFLLFMSGPHLRFLFGYFISIIGLTLASFSYKSLPPVPSSAYLILLFVLTLFMIKRIHDDPKLTASYIKPVDYPDGELKKKIISGKTFYITKYNNQCWDKFPSSYYFIYNIELRGEKIEDGFRIMR